MLPDYVITRKKPIVDKILPFIEMILLLIIVQAVVTLLTMAPEEEETIRFRVLAHSDAPSDQQIKEDIQQEIAPMIEKALATSGSKAELVDNLKALEPAIIAAANGLSDGRAVSLMRTDALFPPKRSGYFIHPQARYDAYVLTIGSGRGDNWWCALFPKICFPDKEEAEDEKVVFFIWEWIKKLFS
ncbi:stage II sporulation protein R [Sporosarcina sp. 179-K 3D1 HS]|uniref:stage II sporulation protein R n=1 Tax=Sporosarcina sp. 179-K 3D1 HS TaxID=3232169 RepID=UPI0039A15CB4